MLAGFIPKSKKMNEKEHKNEIKKAIQQQLEEDRAYEKKIDPRFQEQEQAKNAPQKIDKNQPVPQQETEKIKDPVQIGKEEDSRRKFLNDFRPCGLA